MPRKSNTLLQLQCGFSAEIAEHDGMLWLSQTGTNVSAGLSLNETSEISFDESSGEAFFSTLAFMTLPSTRGQAAALAKMLSVSFHVYERLDTEEEAEESSSSLSFSY